MMSSMAFHEILDLFNTHDQPWRVDAACAGMDPEVFYPARGVALHEALAVCGRCPVRAACAEWAIGHEALGVWGGMSERQRRRARRASSLGRLELRDDGLDDFDRPPPFDGVAEPQEVA